MEKKDRINLLIAGSVMLATGAGVFLSWNATKTVAPEMARAWVMDKSRWLSQLVDAEIRQLRTDVHRTYAMVQSLPASGEDDGAIRFQEEEWIYDLSLWQKSSTTGQLERVALAVNSNRVGSVSAWRAKLKLADPVDDNSIRDAMATGVYRIAANWSLGVSSGLITLISPIKERDSTSAFLVAHLDARRMQKFFAYQNDPGETSTALVDSRGRLIAYQDPKTMDGSHQYQDVLPDAQWTMTPVRSTSGWSIAVSRPGEEAFLASSSRVRARLGFLLFAELIGFALTIWGWPYLRRIRNIKFFKKYPYIEVTLGAKASKKALSSPIMPALETTPSTTVMAASSSLAFVLCGQLKGIEELLEKSGSMGPDEVMDSVREFQSLVRHRASQSEGKFESVEHGAFFVSWDSDAGKKALKCVLDLRADFAAWMESRKVDGKRSLKVAMSMHQGSYLVGTLIGEVFQDARALCSMSAEMDVDFLVTQSVYDSMSGFLICESVGDVKLTKYTGLVAAYFVKGYKNSSGQDVVIETPFSGQAKNVSVLTSKKWRVNNGSTIEGPLAAPEIAMLLFSQEIDFDSECWEEGSGKSSTVAEAEIFSGVEEVGAGFWVFDGETIHGPVSQKFITAMIGRGALNPEKSYVCEGSTLQGWKTLNEFGKAVAASEPPAFTQKAA